ncbi:MAPEG family protein [Pseudomonas cremoricolorata]|uniref:MAPEG family protein n=1 Tax=Pseudomonas cremoricolorata TaxID=157783 RepID=UPI000421C2C2|nr:MAPEG family protein [Pseudomonas cremoricolorata]
MNSALSVYASCAVVLFLKMFALSCYQGFYRLRHKAFINVEDAAIFRRAPRAQELAPVIRAGRAWANDLENIPAFFALGGLAVALNVPAMLTVWLSLVFTLARVLHTVAYLSGVQPWRTLCYGAGVLCLAGLCAGITWVAIKA